MEEMIWSDSLPGRLAARDLFAARPTDIIVVSFPQCGTTWLEALAFATLQRKEYPVISDHPLLTANPHDLVHYIEWYYLTGRVHELDQLPSPRLLATHSPYSVLPAFFVPASGCRVLYVCREPKDAFVSGWHFNNGMNPLRSDDMPMARAFDMFCEGVVASGPIWDHYLEYYRESLDRPQNVLFLRYEEMMKDAPANLKRIAEFIGCPFSKEEEDAGVVEEIVKLCSFEHLSNLEVNKSSGKRLQDLKKQSSEKLTVASTNSLFFRKGEVGDWKNHLSPEMAKKLDDVMLEKLHGSGLSFGVVAAEEEGEEESSSDVPSAAGDVDVEA